MKLITVGTYCLAALILMPTSVAAQETTGVEKTAAAIKIAQRAPPPTAPSVAAPLQSSSRGLKSKPNFKAKTKQKPRKRRIARKPKQLTAHELYITMVRGAIVSLNQANFTGNYTVLYGLTTRQLRAKVSLQQFARAFANLRARKVDLTPALIQLPKFTKMPRRWPKDVLPLAGYFTTPTMRIEFVVVYRPHNGVWHIDALSVKAKNLSDRTARAPKPKPPKRQVVKSPVAKPRVAKPWVTKSQVAKPQVAKPQVAKSQAGPIGPPIPVVKPKTLTKAKPTKWDTLITSPTAKKAN